MTAIPARDLATKQPAQIVRTRTTPRPVRRDRSGNWVIAFLLFGLPILFIAAAALGFIAAG